MISPELDLQSNRALRSSRTWRCHVHSDDDLIERVSNAVGAIRYKLNRHWKVWTLNGFSTYTKRMTSDRAVEPGAAKQHLHLQHCPRTKLVVLSASNGLYLRKRIH